MPSDRELFRGDFRAVRQQTAVFFADTLHIHTYIHIYRRTQTLNPPLRIGAPGNYMTGKGVQKEFKRYAYTISDRASNLTLIHYKGDDSIVNENPHVRTCGSVLRELENSTQSPSVVYKKKIVVAQCLVQYCYSVPHKDA